MRKWDARFYEMACHVRGWVKGPDLGVGCIVVSPDKRLISAGYSGFPRSMPEEAEWCCTVKDKDEFMIHAEANAILNARRSVEGWSMYCTKFPCTRCAAMIMQAGIVKVVALPPEKESRWYQNQKDSADALKENGVEVIFYGVQAQ